MKNKARKGKEEKEDKTLKCEKPPHQVCVRVFFFFWGGGVIFTIKLGKILKF